MKPLKQRRRAAPEILKFVQLVPSDDLNTPMYAIDSKGRCWQHPARGQWILSPIYSSSRVPGFEWEPNRGRR